MNSSIISSLRHPKPYLLHYQISESVPLFPVLPSVITCCYKLRFYEASPWEAVSPFKARERADSWMCALLQYSPIHAFIQMSTEHKVDLGCLPPSHPFPVYQQTQFLFGDPSLSPSSSTTEWGSFLVLSTWMRSYDWEKRRKEPKLLHQNELKAPASNGETECCFFLWM